MDIQLYDRHSIDELPWPSTEQGEYARRFLLPLLKQGLPYFIRNVSAKIYALKVNELVVPVVVGTQGENNSYICSPYGHYIGHSGEGVRLIDNPFLAHMVRGMLYGFSKIGSFGKMGSVAYVNHWLFSTDLYPRLFTLDETKAITAYLHQRFPAHAIAMRSLTEKTNAKLLNHLQDQGFHLILSRYVLYSDTKDESIFKTRIMKSDLKLLRETHYEVVDQVEFSDVEVQQMLTLYKDLYIDKHSKINPQYDFEFLKMLIQQQLLKFKIVRLEGDIKGVAGYFEREGVFMCPFFGYNKDETQSNTIYRLLNTALALEAKEKQLLFHQSSGASFYKTVRRAEGCFESMALYCRHLPWQQRFTWASLKLFINTFAPPYMKKY